MTNPNDPHDADFRATLPEELQSLDRELSGIRIEERQSFAPELEGELAEAWRDRPKGGFGSPRPWVRNLIAAALAGVMIAGVSVPSARAAVVQLVRTVAEEVFPGFFGPEIVAEPELPEIEVQQPVPPAETRSDVVLSPMDASDAVETSQPELMTLPEVEITFPEIISRQEATRIIASHYPVELRDAGVEGSIKLTFWVTGQGSTEAIQMRESSGHPQLDYAAMLAAREIKFRPATRNGVGVGTWVEVDVHFFAISGDGIIGSDSTDSGS